MVVLPFLWIYLSVLLYVLLIYVVAVRYLKHVSCDFLEPFFIFYFTFTFIFFNILYYTFFLKYLKIVQLNSASLKVMEV